MILKKKPQALILIARFTNKLCTREVSKKRSGSVLSALSSNVDESEKSSTSTMYVHVCNQFCVHTCVDNYSCTVFK